MAAFEANASKEIVAEAFNNLLGRPADQQALDYYSRHISADGVSAISMMLRGIVESDEFLHGYIRKKNLVVTDTTIDLKMKSDARYEAIDFKNLFPLSKYQQVVDDIKAACPNLEQQEYVDYHYDRFRELFGLVLYFSDKAQSLCEISTSPASRCMKTIFGGHYASVDQPGGYPENLPNPRTLSDRHLHADMNYQGLYPTLQKYNIDGFDLILFTEIIEHLLKSPFDIVADLASCLRPGGRLFISTPNVFSHSATKLMALKRHPTPMLPRGFHYASGARHVREYTMEELMYLVTDNGLEVESFSFSDCWDRDAALKRYLNRFAEQRSCLYLIARKPLA